MFNSDFYPTPPHLANVLLYPYTEKWERGYGRSVEMVLDPSAGKGDLLNAIKFNKYRTGKEVVTETRRSLKGTTFHAIEIEPQLAASCIGQGYVLVSQDCLTYRPDVLYDHVFMNPPFSNQEDHIIASWNFVKPGGRLDAIVSSKLFNHDTEKRKRVRELIKKYGKVENVGQPFIDAERKTKVDVSIIRLKKPHDERSSIFSDGFEKDYSAFDIEKPNELMKANKLSAVVDTYNAAKIHLQDFIKSRQRLFNVMKQISGSNSFPEQLLNAIKSGTPEIMYQESMKYIQSSSWKQLFIKMDFSRSMTTEVKKDFQQLINSKSGLPFTEANIKQVFSDLISNMDYIQQSNIEQVFEEFRRFHKDNTEPWLNEGWKTNDAYRVKRKVILPRVVRADWHFRKPFNWEWSSYRCARSLFEDIDVAMAQVTGHSSLKSSMEKRFDAVAEGEDYRESFESDHFKIRMFKKGTVHLTFLKKETWQDFCLAAAKNKGWLPG